MAYRLRPWPIVTIVVGIVILLIALPQTWKPSWLPGPLKNPALHLGLDLVGGTQLDFRISEEEIRAQEEKLQAELKTMEAQEASAEQLSIMRLQLQSISEQRGKLVEAIRTVLERRINSLGVSEATITPSYVGSEKHLLVECPGVIDTQECIRVVGKTIQLEFKEEFTEATDEFRATVRGKADAAYRRITISGATLQQVGQDLGNQLGSNYQDSQVIFRDQLPVGLESLWGTKPGNVIMKEANIKAEGQDAQGNPTVQEVPGIFLVQVLAPLTSTGRTVSEAPKAFALLQKTESGATYTFSEKIDLAKVPVRVAGAIRGMQAGVLKSVAEDDGSAHIIFLRGTEIGEEKVDVSHILVTYKGASAAAGTVTRTKEEAQKRAQDLKKQLDAGTDFGTLAKAESDGPSALDSGKLGFVTKGQMPPTFEQVAFKNAAGSVSEPVETQYGYHIIRVNAAPVKTPDTSTFDDLKITGTDALARADAIIANLQNGNVKSIEEALTVRTLFFSLQPTGWKDTALTGKNFRSAVVSLDPVTNIPVVQIAFDSEGGKLFAELTKANIGKRIAIFVGGELVSAPVVQAEITGGTAVITGSSNVKEAQALAQDLNTGAIPAPIYLVGQNTIEATLGAVALRTSLQAALIGTIILMLYMLFVYRLLGVVADIALLIYATMLFALMKLPLLLVTNNYIVLTLAGMAGIILSIGMAVDANVLVFERMKEEIRKGKNLKTSVETSFRYAMPAIRDSNVSAIITCVILFVAGTSIVRGFAVTLGMGVVLSLFTAVVITRWMLRKLATMKIAENPALMPAKQETPNA